MKKLITLFIGCSLAATPWEESRYFDTQFLKNHKNVRTSLIKEEGFQEGNFQTDDNIPIHYLFKKRPHARVTMICCAGFFPGKKEGVASLYAMMPEDTNILFFDARGHGQSGGSCKKLWEYGINEYKDIIGAIKHANSQDKCPIVVWGTCSGSFNAAHALRHLTREQKIKQYNVRGMVFDSGWASYHKVSYSGPVSEARSTIQRLFAQCVGKNCISTALSAGCSQLSTIFLALIHRFVYTPLINRYEENTALYDKINEITVPILYIHSEDDSYVDIKEAKKLAEKTNDSTEWWIQEKSRHACHHLKHKKAYRFRISNFINTAISKEKNE